MIPGRATSDFKQLAFGSGTTELAAAKADLVPVLIGLRVKNSLTAGTAAKIQTGTGSRELFNFNLVDATELTAVVSVLYGDVGESLEFVAAGSAGNAFLGYTVIYISG